MDGQVLVVHDMLGITNEFSPRFLRRYADLHGIMSDAFTRYIADVKSGDFPNEKEQYLSGKEEAELNPLVPEHIP